jgi:hypothetical protein
MELAVTAPILPSPKMISQSTNFSMPVGCPSMRNLTYRSARKVALIAIATAFLSGCTDYHDLTTPTHAAHATEQTRGAENEPHARVSAHAAWSVGFEVERVADRTENMAQNARGWRDARARREKEVRAIERDQTFDGQQQFLETTAILANERRLSRIAILSRRPSP